MIKIANKGDISYPNPPLAADAIKRAPTMAVNPKPDSADRSKLPEIMAKDCPITNIPKDADLYRMLTRLKGVRKLGDKVENIASAASTRIQIRLAKIISKNLLALVFTNSPH
jgi:hypothetical protein